MARITTWGSSSMPNNFEPTERERQFMAYIVSTFWRDAMTVLQQQIEPVVKKQAAVARMLCEENVSVEDSIAFSETILQVRGEMPGSEPDTIITEAQRRFRAQKGEA
jgi:hypothetical protein